MTESEGPLTITVKPAGTIVIHGVARIVDPEGHEIPIPVFKQPGVIKLCGCGRSGNKPFCDGSHKQGGGAARPTGGDTEQRG